MIQKKRKQRNEVIDKLKALIASLFSAGEQGAFYVPQPIVLGTQALFQDAAGTTPVTADGDPDGSMSDQSPNGHTAVQTISSKRPTYNTSPERLSLDKVDDALIITVPTGGWNGTMVLATDEGTVSYGVDIPAGDYNLGGEYFPGNAIVGVVFRDGAMTAQEIADTESFFVGNGATASYGGVNEPQQYWRNRLEIVKFPIIDISSANNVFSSWRFTGIIEFPLLDFSSCDNFVSAWRDSEDLEIFAANSFDNIAGGNFNGSFLDTKLNQSSIDGILVSLVTSGIAAGIFDQSGGSAPSVDTGQPAIDTLRSRDWDVDVEGGY